MRNVLLGLLLLLTSSGFTQELNGYRNKELEKEIKILTEVMELSPRQIKKMRKVKTAQGLQIMKIYSSVEKGTNEADEAWKNHSKEFQSKTRSVVSEKQWNEWLAYTCTKCNKPAEEESSEKIKPEIPITLSKATIHNVDVIVEEMAQVMSLYEDQKEAVRAIKIKLAQSYARVYMSTEKGPERTVIFDKLNKASFKKIRELTSKEQMDFWWAHWESTQEEN